MENQDILELINAFLDEELSEDQAREVERRMAEDAEFRKGVALQKDLRSAYRQSGRIRLRNRMAEIMEEPIPEEDNNVPSTKNKAMPFGKWLLLLAAIVIVLLATWFFSRPEKRLIR
jgi:anti-sigma factor RsiW